MVVYGVAVVVTFLVVLWLTGRGRTRREVEVPRWWRLSGVMVWISLLVGGFAAIAALLDPLVSSLPGSARELVGGVVLGAIVALVVRLGAGIALEADMGLFRWAVLFQLIALGGDILAAGSTGITAYAALAVVPAFGLVCLYLAFRNPPKKQTPARPQKRRT
jgi:hypothetical protein